MTNHDLRHTEGGNCWCNNDDQRVAALDQLYPDRCQLPLLPPTPSEIADNPNAARRTCVHPAGHQEPCRGALERTGDPCHYCGQPTIHNPTGPGCTHCWTDLTTMNLADIKAIFAQSDISLSAPYRDEQ